MALAVGIDEASSVLVVLPVEALMNPTTVLVPLVPQSRILRVVSDVEVRREVVAETPRVTGLLPDEGVVLPLLLDSEELKVGLEVALAAAIRTGAIGGAADDVGAMTEVSD